MIQKVNDLDVIRMRQRQIENLYQVEELKVACLEKQKDVTGSYQVLAVMEV